MVLACLLAMMMMMMLLLLIIVIVFNLRSTILSCRQMGSPIRGDVRKLTWMEHTR